MNTNSERRRKSSAYASNALSVAASKIVGRVRTYKDPNHTTDSKREDSQEQMKKMVQSGLLMKRLLSTSPQV